MHLEILLEEQSMENVINTILTRLVGDSEEYQWQTHPHQGKGHLLKRLRGELRAYGRMPVDYQIVVIVDQDNEDCKKLKQQILEWAAEAGLADRVTVRIAVAELESWFLGDGDALKKVFPRLKIGEKACYREPDKRPDPVFDLQSELEKAKAGKYFKLRHSAEISQYMNLEPDHNRSRSFQVTLSALRHLLD